RHRAGDRVALGRWPAIFTAVLSGLFFVFCFVPPTFTFAISDLAYVTTLLGFLVVGIASSELALRSHRVLLERATRELAEARSQAKISHRGDPPSSVWLWNLLNSASLH